MGAGGAWTCTDLLAPPDRLSRLGQPFPTLLPLAPRCRPLQPQPTRPPPAPSLLALQQGDQISALCCCYRTDGACPCSRAPLPTRGPDLLRRPRAPQPCTDLLAPPDRLSRLGQPFTKLLPLAPRFRPLQPQGTRPPPAPSLLALQQGDHISASQANPIVKHPHGLLNANICSS